MRANRTVTYLSMNADKVFTRCIMVSYALSLLVAVVSSLGYFNLSQPDATLVLILLFLPLLILRPLLWLFEHRFHRVPSAAYYWMRVAKELRIKSQANGISEADLLLGFKSAVHFKKSERTFLIGIGTALATLVGLIQTFNGGVMIFSLSSSTHLLALIAVYAAGLAVIFVGILSRLQHYGHLAVYLTDADE